MMRKSLVILSVISTFFFVTSTIGAAEPSMEMSIGELKALLPQADYEVALIQSGAPRKKSGWLFWSKSDISDSADQNQKAAFLTKLADRARTRQENLQKEANRFFGPERYTSGSHEKAQKLQTKVDSLRAAVRKARKSAAEAGAKKMEKQQKKKSTAR